MIRRIEFRGLRRIAAATLREKIGSRENAPVDAAQVEADVRALDSTGWFDSVTAEIDELPVQIADARLGAPLLPPPAFLLAPPHLETQDPALRETRAMLRPSLRLTFVVAERPYLTKVEFRGSRQLTRDDIQAAIAARGLHLKTAAPINRTALYKVSRAIEAALAERGYPRPQVRLRLRDVPTHSVRATFEIIDGPRIEVGEVIFTGNETFESGELRQQMKRVAPHARLAGTRGKTIYTATRLAEDLQRLEAYYRDRGFAEARIGAPQIELIDDAERRRWFPWPRRERKPAFRVSIPVEEGPHYTVASVKIDVNSLRLEPELLPNLRSLRPAEEYSQEKLLRAQAELANRLAGLKPKEPGPRPEVEVLPEFDREAGVVHVTLRARVVDPYIVTRIEFAGHHHFSDTYYRRRIQLREGDLLDFNKLQRGLDNLARGGFIRPVERRDIDLKLDDDKRTAELTIRIEELGRQRISLVGGAGSFSSTLGIAYNLFDFFGGEELITGTFEGGPESVQALLGIAREGIFGSRLTLGLTLFHSVLRPRLAGRNRLYTSRADGLGWNASLPLTPRDTLGWNYEFSNSSTRVHLDSLGLPPELDLDSLTTRNSRRAIGAVWTHQGGGRRWQGDASLAGGLLGGDENLLRAGLEYARLEPDPLTRGRNTWALRTTFAGLASFDGPTPLHRRFFGGEQLVRGFRTGELTPYAVSRREDANGLETFVATATGANLVAAFNGEYRIPLRSVGAQRSAPGLEGAVFVDAGAGWLVPQWLGGTRPQVLGGTSGLLRASTGVELSLPVPGLGQPVRVYYAVNPLRLASALLLPDGSRFRAPDRFSAWGWGLGRLF
ncbi:MAG TPA: POTRA domain-containing protein [Candidatus Acidoferrales bacterium]